MKPLCLAIIALTAAGCGPSELEAGQAILLAAPLITLLGMLVQIGYTKLWRPMHPDLDTAVRPAGLTAAAALGVLTISVAVRGPTDVLEWGAFALAFVGTSYLTILALTLSVFVKTRLRRYLPLAPVFCWSILGGPAIAYALLGSATAEIADWTAMLWILPGYGGYATIPALAIVFIEVLLVRRVHRRRNAPPPEPVFPTAKVVKDAAPKK